MSSSSKRLLLFGANGALGAPTAKAFRSHGWKVFTVVRTATNAADEIVLPLAESKKFAEISAQGGFESVVFAQGINMNGTVMTTTAADMDRLFQANVGFVIEHVQFLMGRELIPKKGKIVIMSSLAEVFTRKEKLAYSVTKAAVGGLVRSLSVDLGRSHQILVNGILPGVVDTPMSRKGLTSDQMANVLEATPVGSLVVPADVGNSVYLLGSDLNTGISGQSLLVDNAFSVTFLP